MIKIGIDISLSSTSVYIRCPENDYIFCYMNSNKTKKWSKLLAEIENVNINIYDYKYSKDYSTGEIDKIKSYDTISDMIISDIKNVCGDNMVNIAIEGYSYTKNTNSLNDIISLSTLIRIKLINNLNCEIKFVPPNKLKLETAKYCYGEKETERFSKSGKKLKSTFRIENNNGIAGGSFTKFEMFESILDKNVKSLITEFLKNNTELMSMKKIPSPIDDINDSLFLCIL